jgi:hypothetical protein
MVSRKLGNDRGIAYTDRGGDRPRSRTDKRKKQNRMRGKLRRMQQLRFLSFRKKIRANLIFSSSLDYTQGADQFILPFAGLSPIRIPVTSAPVGVP